MARRKTRSLPQRMPLTDPLNLSTHRQKQGISLEQIAEATKISIRFLRAIEAEEFEQLPGGIFNTSYLRQYAAAIGYDEGHLLAHYELKMNITPTPKAPQPDSGSRRFLDRWLGIPAQAQH